MKALTTHLLLIVDGLQSIGYVSFEFQTRSEMVTWITVSLGLSLVVWAWRKAH